MRPEAEDRALRAAGEDLAGSGGAEVARRSAAQLPDEEKAARADFVIDNSGTVEATTRQVEALWTKLQDLAAHSH